MRDGMSEAANRSPPPPPPQPQPGPALPAPRSAHGAQLRAPRSPAAAAGPAPEVLREAAADGAAASLQGGWTGGRRPVLQPLGRSGATPSPPVSSSPFLFPSEAAACRNASALACTSAGGLVEGHLARRRGGEAAAGAMLVLRVPGRVGDEEIIF